MILGIGTDVVDISRIEQKILTREGFRQMVFSENEVAHCDKMKFRFENYAARFAGKEAFLKAIGTGLFINNDLKEIEILNEESGRPYLKLSGELQEKVKEIFKIRDFKIHVSLSHTSAVATAFIIIESYNNELA